MLCAPTPGGIEQEIYALLVTYQALCTAIADAASTVPGTDHDRASFTIALNTDRDQVTLSAGVIAGSSIDLAGAIGRVLLAALMPSRRLGISPRVVKRALSRYNAKGKVDRATYNATIDFVILIADLPAEGGPNLPALGLEVELKLRVHGGRAAAVPERASLLPTSADHR